MSEGKKVARTNLEETSLGSTPNLIAFREEIERFQPQIEAMLGETMSYGAFLEVATTAYVTTPALQKCSPSSVVLAIRRSAQLRLRPDGIEGALIPRGGKANFEPMYQGIIRKMLRTGTVKKVEAHVVKLEDHFEYGYGLDPYLNHRPHRPLSERTATTEAYAVIWLTNGERQFEVMGIDDLEAIRDKAREQNRGKEGPAWRTQPDEMRRKIVVKRLSKYIEQDADLAAVIAYDNSIDSGHPIDPADIDPGMEWRTVDERAQEHAERQSAALRDAIDAQEDEEIEEAEVVSSEVVNPLDRVIHAGEHKGKTYRAVLEEKRGWVTHWVITPKSGDYLTDDQKNALAHAIDEWDAEQAMEAEEES